MQLSSQRLTLEADAEAAYERFDAEGWIDGHPIIPPTLERVERMLDFAERRMARKSDEVVAVIEPYCGECTVEKIAVSAVMAGCKPEYMPVLVAAIECMREGRARFQTVLMGSHTRSPLLIINGPIRHDLNIQSGSVGRTGGSWRANAAIGRAFRFALMNTGGFPGASDKRTFGWLGSFDYCIGENEEASPWDPFHVERGWQRSDSTVTLTLPESPHHVEAGPWSYSAQDLMQAFCDSMCNVGSRAAYGETDPIFFFGMDHAKEVAAAGFSKDDVKKFFYEHARIPLYRYPKTAPQGFSLEYQKFYSHSPHIGVPMAMDAARFLIFVMGGPGPNSWYVPGHHSGSLTRKIHWPV